MHTEIVYCDLWFSSFITPSYDAIIMPSWLHKTLGKRFLAKHCSPVKEKTARRQPFLSRSGRKYYFFTFTMIVAANLLP